MTKTNADDAKTDTRIMLYGAEVWCYPSLTFGHAMSHSACLVGWCLCGMGTVVGVTNVLVAYGRTGAIIT